MTHPPSTPPFAPPRELAPPPTVDWTTARREMAAKTKPLGALGRLEDAAARLSVLQGTLRPRLDRTRVCVFAADHGVAEEGISAYPQSVTAEMMRSFDRGGAAINVISLANDVDVEVIDVGVDADLRELTRVRHEKVRRSSRNLAREPAMTPAEFDAAIAVGTAAAERAAADGVRALGLGEMGIGNTTAAAAILSAFTGESSAVTVGRGTGVDDTVFARKREVVDRAVRFHRGDVDKMGGEEVLRRLGGLELAAMAGAARAAAAHGIAVVADGFISTTAVLCALHMLDDADRSDAHPLQTALFFSHRSSERGHRLALEMCGAMGDVDSRPLLDLEMRLGEGTGAALVMPLLRAAAAVMREMATFAQAGVSAGQQAAEHSAGPRS
jgi:nicotinate-nucleotide--dimethylbenzimidazole phosphoribosyltransferase